MAQYTTSDNVKILEVESKWFERGVWEAIQIRINSPTLNKDECRYNLPPVWNNTLKKMGRRGRGGDQVPGPPTRRCSHTTSTVPPYHLMDV